jgi:membrane-associated phospholipid phosphatase
VLVLFLVAVVAPAAIVFAVCIVFARYPSRGAAITKSYGLRRKLWELHAGWLGLALSVVISFFLTQTLKNMFGKPRPDLLARCNPDFTRYPVYVVGGYTNETLEGTSVLVSWNVCQSKSGSGVGKAELQDGFRSFPSGHSTSTYQIQRSAAHDNQNPGSDVIQPASQGSST